MNRTHTWKALFGLAGAVVSLAAVDRLAFGMGLVFVLTLTLEAVTKESDHATLRR